MTVWSPNLGPQLIPKWCHWSAVSCNRKPYGEHALSILPFKALRPSQTGKHFRKDHSDLSVKHGMSSAQISFWLDGIWAFLPTLKSREEIFFFLPELLFISKLFIFWEGGGRHLIVCFGRYFALPQVISHLPNNLWDEWITCFSCERQKGKRKITHNSLEKQHGIKNGKRATSYTFHLPPANTV